MSRRVVLTPPDSRPEGEGWKWWQSDARCPRCGYRKYCVSKRGRPRPPHQAKLRKQQGAGFWYRTSEAPAPGTMRMEVVAESTIPFRVFYQRAQGLSLHFTEEVSDPGV